MRSLFELIFCEKVRITWATRVTLARLGLVPVVVLMVWNQQWVGASWLFVGAAVTDFLDGYLARIRNEKTVLGALLDVTADKLLMIAVLIMLLLRSTLVTVPLWILWAILLKEIVVLGGALVLLARQGVQGIRPPFIAKMSMAGEMIFVAWCLFAYAYEISMPIFVPVLLGALMIASGAVYVHQWLTK